MDKQQFKQFIEQVAVVKEAKPTTTGFRLDENSGGEVRYENQWIEVGRHQNPTLGFTVVKLKEQHRLCELGCGDIVANQVIEQRLATHPVKHWRTRCQTCDCYVSPDGQGFIRGGSNIQNAYISWFKHGKSMPAAPKVTHKELDGPVEIREYSKDRDCKYQVDASGNISLKPEADK